MLHRTLRNLPTRFRYRHQLEANNNICNRNVPHKKKSASNLLHLHLPDVKTNLNEDISTLWKFYTSKTHNYRIDICFSKNTPCIWWSITNHISPTSAYIVAVPFSISNANTLKHLNAVRNRDWSEPISVLSHNFLCLDYQAYSFYIDFIVFRYFAHRVINFPLFYLLVS